MEVTNISFRISQGIGEGPHYDATTDELVFVDLPDLTCGQHGRLCRRKYGDSSMQTESHDIGQQHTSFVIPTNSGSYLVSYGSDISEIEWPKGGNPQPPSILYHLDEGMEGKTTYLNDAKCDSRGRLVAGTMCQENGRPESYLKETGTVVGLNVDRSLCVIDNRHRYTLSNGLAWIQDESRFFLIDSIMNKVFVFDYDPDGFSASNRRVLFDFSAQTEVGQSLLDGCCIDRNDRLWICCYSGKKILCLDTTTGKLMTEVKIPTLSPTSCCFAGSSLNELVVTSSKFGSPESDTEAGSLYRVVNTGASGFGGVKFMG